MYATICRVILVVEPDAKLASSLGLTLRGEGVVRVIERFDDALAIVRGDEPITLLVMRAPLPDGAWDALLEEARVRHATVPVLVIGDVADAATLRRVFALDATFTCGPVPEGDLVRFARRHVSHQHLANVPHTMRDAIAAVATKYQLRANQLRLLVLAIEGRSRREIANTLSLPENTVKSQIRDLLKRCEARSLADLSREAFQFAISPGSAAANREQDRAAT
jgi:DNA-binding NarL/FixJ family response regulator